VEYTQLPDEIRETMNNGIPAIVVTSSASGVPNATIISQAYYVDSTHVALSFQFFNKTVRNVRENDRACLLLNDIPGFTNWVLNIRYDHSESEGQIFEEMDMQIEAIASATGLAGIFKLQAVDIYKGGWLRC
jgi:hypothetical protein